LEEIEDLSREAAVQRALELIVEMDARTLADHIALTEIPAPPFQEQARARAYARLLAQAGADSVYLDEVGNAVAIRRGSSGSRTVVLGAHLDTVFPEGTDVTVKQRGDTLFAPGIGDDTRGLAVVLAVLRALNGAQVETEADLVFVGTVGEEGLGDLRGVKHLFREGWIPIDAYVEIDGGGLSSIVNKGLGSVRYRITFRGPGGHSWGAFGLGNPAHALGRSIQAFAEAADVLTSSGPRTSYNVGRFGGGTSINSIPFESWMEVDMRSESPASLDRISQALRDAVQVALEEENRVRRHGPPIEVVVDEIGNRPSGESNPSLPLIQRAMAATRHMGAEPRLSRSSTNSNIPIALGIPAVTIGRGGEGASNHSPDEWWINHDGYLAIQRAVLLVVAEAGLSRGG
jgi:acetylornithine deacetylase/succinyl-diaminopimelate desuccinylase-like protein